jgi:hypothetical protein
VGQDAFRWGLLCPRNPRLPRNPARAVGNPSLNSKKKHEQNTPLRNLYKGEVFLVQHAPLLLPRAGADGTADKTYSVRLKPPEISTQVVVAEAAQVYGEHLVFLNSKRELAALFLLEIVEDWSELLN